MEDTEVQPRTDRERNRRSEAPQKPPVEYRVGMASSIVFIVIAAFFDLLSVIPLIGGAFGFIFWVIFGIFLYTKGIKMWDGKKMAVSAISFLAELFPFVQTLPTLIAGSIAILLMIRIEDKIGVSISNPLRKGTTPPRIQRIPVNSEPGIRRPNNRNADLGSLKTPREPNEEISLAE